MGFLDALKKLFGGSSETPTLQPGDRMLVCEDCNSQFVFDVGEQRFFREKGFTEPKRCPKCRKKVRFRMRRRGRGHGQSHGQNQGGGNRNPNQNGQRHPQNNNNHSQQRKNRHHGRRHSVIDGDSPYADER